MSRHDPEEVVVEEASFPTEINNETNECKSSVGFVLYFTSTKFQLL